MRRLLLCITLVAAALAVAPGSARAVPPSKRPSWPFAGLQFLVGEWTGEGSGTPGQSSAGAWKLEADLAGQILVRTSFAEYPPVAGQKVPARHEDRMVIYAEGTAVKAIYFENEGHVIRYLVTATGKSATFESEAGEPGPRFKLVYEQKAAGSVSIVFSLAPPGSVAYRPYVTGTSRRK